MSDLHIPEAAQEEYFTCGCHDPRCTRVGYQPGALPLVVAAELRRLAKEFRFFTEVGAQAPNQAGVRMLKAAQEKLTARADQLDGGES